jgi:hypothetical protein
MTDEQYGETIGGMQWRSSRIAFASTATSNDKKIVFGVPPSNVRDDTGGLFLGLMSEDDARPTVLEQLGYKSFCLNWSTSQPRLTLARTTDDLLLQPNVGWLSSYDLSPYGPNLHHYAIQCQSVTLKTPTGNVVLSKLMRPVVVVLDSGLTGCVFSDSWKQEDLPVPLETIQGAQLQLDGGETTLTSHDKYWYLSCFRLPWFTSEEYHPHIIAAGATFLTGSELTVDTKRRRLAIQTNPS